MLPSLASRALRLLCFPRLIERLPGPYHVGVRRVRIPGSVACQLLYPATGTSTRRTPYWRPEAIEGLADYAKLPVALAAHLTLASHPCNEAPPPLEGVWPLVVFSHGLGGCEEMYSQLCSFIASHGYVIFVPEHEHTKSSTHTHTFMVSPPHFHRKHILSLTRLLAPSCRISGVSKNFDTSRANARLAEGCP